jgi:hypothetical protein
LDKKKENEKSRKRRKESIFGIFIAVLPPLY